MASLTELQFILKRAADVYGVDVTDKQARGYHTVLGKYPRLVLVQAVTILMGTLKWFPKPSEIEEVARDVNTRYKLAEGQEFDEAARWYMYVNNCTSADDLAADDLSKIYGLLGKAPYWLEMTRKTLAVTK